MCKKYFPLIFLSFVILSYLTISPFLLILKYKAPAFEVFILFSSLLVFLFFIFQSVIDKKQLALIKSSDLKEEINILSSSVSNISEVKKGLIKNIDRYDTLEGFVRELNKNIDLDSLAEFIVKRTFELFAGSDICLLYLLRQKQQQLELFATYKNEPGAVVKAKQGDMVDNWVLKHLSPILVEDLNTDFRFDFSKQRQGSNARFFSSLISAPLISEDRVIGIIRLDSLTQKAYDTDDLRFLDVLSDICALAVSNAILYKQTEELAVTDGLTGLFTRNRLLERLNQELSRAIREKSSLTVLMLDIDYFKNYNDKFGHTAGDIVLKKVAKMLINSSSSRLPIVGRYGGEEFVMVESGMSENEAKDFAQNIRKSIEEEIITLRRENTNVTVSIGVASFPNNGINPQELINNADQALLKAKQQGRNRVCFA